MRKTILAGIIATVLLTSIVTFNTISAQENTVPSWIKNTAGFWANGDISDNEFLNAIEFLINQRIIHVPSSVPQAEAQKLVYTISDTYQIWGITSSLNGHVEELYCKGSDIALSGGFESPYFGIFPNMIKPVELASKTGFAFALVNFASEESGALATIYVTCMTN